MCVCVGLPQVGRGEAARVSVLVDEAACAVVSELLCDVKDWVGKTSLQSVTVLLIHAARPTDYFIVVDGFVYLHHWLTCWNKERRSKLQSNLQFPQF